LLNQAMDFSPLLVHIGEKASLSFMARAFNVFFRMSEKDIELMEYLNELQFAEVPDSLSKSVDSFLQNYPSDAKSLEDILKKDGKDIFLLQAKIYLLKKLETNDILQWGPEGQVGEYESLYAIDKNDLHQTEVYCVLRERLSEYFQIQTLAIKDMEKAEARIRERNKIIADLSHSIKNLISTVIDPLENLKQEHAFRPAVIQNALRGANLVREIVNAINLSCRGSIEDFSYDARHNEGKDAMSLRSIIEESLKYSAGNMFDGKYFSAFMRKYFPEKSIFDEARAQWKSVSQGGSFPETLDVLNKYFMEIELNLEMRKTW